MILKHDLSHMMLSTEETTTFTAQLTSRHEGQGKVRYNLYRSDREDPQTGGPNFPSNFATAGRYSILKFPSF